MSRRENELVGLVVLLFLVWPSSVLAQATILVPFEIEDQHDRVHRDTDLSDRIVILIGSDGEGSTFNGPWASAIRRALQTDPGFGAVSFLDVADVRSVPFFLKGHVKGKFPPAPEDWVLLDWKGALAEAYEFQPGSANIVIFGTDGRLVHRASGRQVDPEVLGELVEAIRQLLSLAERSDRATFP